MAIDKNIEIKKKEASDWFRSLRDNFCKTFEDLDSKKFSRKLWDHKGKGGGEMSIMRGEVFEKVGVNISTVSGEFSEDYREQVKGTSKSPKYWASGISLVAHMNSPKVPAFHFNTRFLVTEDSWFGGGADMTPTIYDKPDELFFHDSLKKACDKNNEDYYQEFKKNCDEYFYLPHRKEPRGIGGIFFDHLNTGDWEQDFNFVKDVGLETLKIISKVVSDKKDLPWNEDEKEKQLIKRGRYVEFNLIWDRGTLFGLKTGGSTEAIMMSMPPEAKWD
jgi:coproporphyrinogen III oxidase